MPYTCTCTSTNVKVLVLYLSTFTCTSPHACMRLPIITFVSHWLCSQLLGKIRMYIHKYILMLYTHVVHSYLLVKFFNLLLNHIWPKVTLKVCQLCDTDQVIINRLSVHILNTKESSLNHTYMYACVHTNPHVTYFPFSNNTISFCLLNHLAVPFL